LKKQDAPSGRDKPEIVAALRASRAYRDLAKRIDVLSRRFLGSPYLESPLGGGPDQYERLTAGAKGFDCVTYVETVLALSLSDSERSFSENLRRLRYNRGRVGWKSRNHYMVDWAMRNRAAGFVHNCTRGPGVVERTRSLNLLPSLPTKSVTLCCFSKRWFANHRLLGQSSDVLMFVSTRRNLDVFHIGFLIRRDRERLLRHASRTAGHVVEEKLESFLKKHRMSGVIILRPRCPN
jgi:hypothetical protein